MEPELTTLCYIENEDRYLMLHRVKKEKDINKDKWIGIGGHFEGTESPEECLLREVREETGLTLTDYRYRGIVTFVSGDSCLEYMSLYTATVYKGELKECDEGTLEWIPKESVYDLNLWAGDKLFFRLLEEERPFFSLKLVYDAEGTLCRAALDGRDLELLDVLDETVSDAAMPDEAMPEAEPLRNRKGSGAAAGVFPYNGGKVLQLPVAEVQERDTVHRLGLLHATVHMWVVRTNEAGKREVLLQKRSRNKDSNPGCWDLSSAGHIAAGDERLHAAVRELREELGIRAEPGELTYIGHTRRKTMKPFYGKMWLDNQISYVYLYQGEVEIDRITLQEEEVEEVRWMEPEEVFRRLEDPHFKNCLNPEEIELLMQSLDC